ncbi:unnamed protein product [Amaranthus hypochondriacus]
MRNAMMPNFIFSENCLRTAIVFDGGYHPFLTRNIRSKHKVPGKLLDQVGSHGVGTISRPSNFINKVCIMLGYNNLDGFVNGRTQKTQDFFLEARKKFPSINVGSSPLIELYSDSAWHSQTKTYSPSISCEEFQPIATDGKWMIPVSLTKVCPSLNNSLPDTSFSCEEASIPAPTQFHSDSLKDQQCVFADSEESLPPIVLNNDKLSQLILDKPINLVEGLSKRQSRQLEDCDFHTLRKLLHHFPRSYADLQNSHMGIEDGQYLIFVGRILSSRAAKASYALSFWEVIVHGEVGINGGGKKMIYLHLKKFFRGTRFTSQGFLRCLEKKHEEGDFVCVSGKVRGTSKVDHYEMREYSLDVIENEDDLSIAMKGRLFPIYPSKGGLKPDFFRDIMTRVLQSLHADIDPIPLDITIDIGLLGLHDAYIAIHQPKDLNDADLARRRFVFDEFFYLQLGRMYQMLEGLGSRIEKEVLLERYRNIEQTSVFSEEWSELTRSVLEKLPYSLTKSQLNAISEIILDLKRPVPMNRLLQGDVGCGKTVVAFLACMEVIGSGYQAAYMVPTELLAIQHYEDLCNLLENVDCSCRPCVALLTGSTPAKQARMIRNELQAGTISLVIGTHSLIAESVEFLALRLAVIDEQHRFGVIQRGRLNNKLSCASTSGTGSAAFGDTEKGEMQMAPHVLAMSATPIPRSLALALYGDMSLTQITDLPPGRLPIETCIVEGDEYGFEKVYEMMHHELEAGGKVYLVYPIIEQSELLPQLRAASGDFGTISSKFSNYSCGLLHGKMKGDEKDKALKCFREGETRILLSTQVIETGIDVPDASMMVVMNAERFGMAQLHQLRGRVGRGARKSKCILVASTATSMNRLKELEKSSDGYHLAKVDLLLRGPGDLLGKKQSGHLPDFPIARLEVDGSIIQDAHVAALKVLRTSHDLAQYPALKAELSMRQPLSFLGD